MGARSKVVMPIQPALGPLAQSTGCTTPISGPIVEFITQIALLSLINLDFQQTARSKEPPDDPVYALITEPELAHLAASRKGSPSGWASLNSIKLSSLLL